MTGPAAPRPRTRADRFLVSAGIVKLALQQMRDELTGTISAPDLARVLCELHDEDHRQDGVFGALAQLLTAAAHAAARIEPDRDGAISCPLHEAAALITETAGLQIHYATRVLDPQGEAV
ncbi:hypothetical protein [Streptomyces pakalii]|uniref:Uncharacterized protein n=1 Tax=Streptomyces pakalii TaxID=3036494 RepID=A0ABT7DH73_9ACTN|nr:hypothetical protein [Streptomyces pakalii]MDJ1645174.1 hypothetical protein [Streptomyces pakalii]